MSASITPVQYFYANVKDRPGEAYGFLSTLSGSGVNLLAFNAVPLGWNTTQLVLFPDDPGTLVRAAAASGLVLSGPERAILVQGDDELGALVDVHRQLFEAGVNVLASNGVTDGEGRYGYVIYVRADTFDDAVRVLNLE
jgi:hypothetical protein